jgi:predicted nucleotidyltransferase
MFTVEQRDALRERLLRLAQEDDRVVAGAIVGSLAVGGGDRFSDIDLTFGIADGVRVADVLDHWTHTLVDELDAVRLAELERGPTTYRVFLLPDALQLDLSMTSAARFRPAGPRFRLLFGETAAGGFRDSRAVGRWGSLPSHAAGRTRHIRVGRHLRAPHTRVYRARACLASGALRRCCA